METKLITKGSLLIARPSLNQDVFNRSVVLLTEHGENGSVGFVLNKPTGHSVQDFLSDFPIDLPLFEGGPVEQENIYFVHNRPELVESSEYIGNGIFWSGNYKDILYSLQNGLLKPDEIRFFLGYSGWSEGQLSEEIRGNSWSVTHNNKLNVFKEWTVDLWRKEMKALGGRNILWANSPKNPVLN